MATFKAASFKSKLGGLSESAQSIQTLSHWVCYHRKAAKESAQIWAEEALKAPVERRLLFVYLANDIMQTSRRKGLEFVQEYGAQLRKVLPESYLAAKSETMRSKMMRMLGIWEERRVLESGVIGELRKMMTGGGGDGGGGSGGGAPEAPATGDSVKALALPAYLDCLDEACSVDPLKAQREAALPLAALVAGDAAAVTAEGARAAASLLAEQLGTLRQELSDRRQLVLTLAAAVDKQQALFDKLRGAIDECNFLLTAAEGIGTATLSAAAAGSTEFAGDAAAAVDGSDAAVAVMTGGTMDMDMEHDPVAGYSPTQ